jgi:predicted 3-demethylubiquinone-9 3-methyltransferase (glyoxalase superfamily)
MSVSVRPFLMFEGRAEEAMRLYVSLLPGSEVLDIERYGPGSPGKEGTVMRAMFKVAGQLVQCTDSFVHHAFTFTPSFSFFVDCESEAQLETLWKTLSESGSVMMPLDNYGFSRRFGWLGDRFGVSWQLNLPYGLPRMGFVIRGSRFASSPRDEPLVPALLAAVARRAGCVHGLDGHPRGSLRRRAAVLRQAESPRPIVDRAEVVLPLHL